MAIRGAVTVEQTRSGNAFIVGYAGRTTHDAATLFTCDVAHVGAVSIVHRMDGWGWCQGHNPLHILRLQHLIDLLPLVHGHFTVRATQQAYPVGNRWRLAHVRVALGGDKALGHTVEPVNRRLQVSTGGIHRRFDIHISDVIQTVQRWLFLAAVARIGNKARHAIDAVNQFLNGREDRQIDGFNQGASRGI